MRSLPIAALTLLAGLAVTVGCSGPAEDRESDEPRREGSPTAPSTPPVEAKDALRRAVRNLGSANTGHVTLTIPLTDDVGTVEEGDYQISPLRADVTRILTSGDLRVAFRYVTVGKDTWMRLDSISSDEDGAWGCWVDLRDISRVNAADGTPMAAPGQLPGALQVADLGMGESFVAGGTNEVEGTTDLYTLLASIGGASLQTASGVGPSDATAPVRFQLNGEMLIGFEVDLATVPREVSEAAADHPYPWLAHLSGSDGVMIAYLAKIGQPVEIVAPKPREIVEFTGPSDFESALESCGRGAEPT